MTVLAECKRGAKNVGTDGKKGSHGISPGVGIIIREAEHFDRE